LLIHQEGAARTIRSEGNWEPDSDLVEKAGDVIADFSGRLWSKLVQHGSLELDHDRAGAQSASYNPDTD
jgi:hypothetical protein